MRKIILIFLFCYLPLTAFAATDYGNWLCSTCHFSGANPPTTGDLSFALGFISKTSASSSVYLPNDTISISDGTFAIILSYVQINRFGSRWIFKSIVRQSQPYKNPPYSSGLRADGGGGDARLSCNGPSSYNNSGTHDITAPTGEYTATTWTQDGNTITITGGSPINQTISMPGPAYARPSCP